MFNKPTKQDGRCSVKFQSAKQAAWHLVNTGKKVTYGNLLRLECTPQDSWTFLQWLKGEPEYGLKLAAALKTGKRARRAKRKKVRRRRPVLMFGYNTCSR